MFDSVLNMPLCKELRNKSYDKFKTLWPQFMDGTQLSQGYRATVRRQFAFYHPIPRSSWYSFNQLRREERLNNLDLEAPPQQI